MNKHIEAIHSELFNSTLEILKANDRLIDLLSKYNFSESIAQLEINNELNDKLKELLQKIS